MLFTHLRQFVQPLARTPLHPQWLMSRENYATKQAITPLVRGCVIDIGCGDRWLADCIGERGNYIGLDYPPTITQGYPGLADVFGDAVRLPFRNATADSVLLLDVLEHLPSPDAAISEAARVLKPGGLLILQVPFMYPVHDAPNDFHRWTLEGLRQLLIQNGLRLVDETTFGHPVETAAALGAIALAKSGLNILSRPRLAILLLPLITLLIPLVNVAGWLLGKALPADSFMPLSYRLVAERSA
ncbi:MAG TPA: class I SAM-dependent methyltransferase [Gammaproteobacteria bacterium]|jgi:SAM-dependent methyltransferase|nr:class I SAM-dependent methyltransferase [Gammaproteobacteria bacterium]